MSPPNRQKALAADVAVVVRVAPCKSSIAKNRIMRHIMRHIMHRSVRRMAARPTGKALPFCTAKPAPIVSATATSAPVNHRSIWS
jgi:hypothetical protein